MQWSIYLLNDLPNTIDAVVERLTYEWGDMGHSQAPRTRFTLPAAAVARICRVTDDDAELSMSVTLQIGMISDVGRVSFELGKLYRYRDQTFIEVLGKAGWLRSADEVRPP